MLNIKTICKTCILLLTGVIISQCKKDSPAPNENWVPGASWVDTRDGHAYLTVPIGKQIWMSENMAYLPSVSKIADGSEDEGKETDPYYYVYDYDGTDISDAKATSNYNRFGVLYNWTAALDACPDGWHLPTDSEWIDMELFLGMSPDEVTKRGNRGTDEGCRIKATWGWDFITWMDKFGNGTNETGFTGLPAGGRYWDYSVDPYEYVTAYTGSFGYWWTATVSNESWVWCRYLVYYSDLIWRYEDEKNSAMSVRCIKN